MANDMINRVLAGRYEILESLGEGPLLAAYRARDRAANRIVTIKTLLPAFASRADIVETLKTGLGQTLSLTHTAITRTYDVGHDEETGLLYLAEEYVRGIDLKERIRRAAPFQLAAATDTAITILEALEVAHARGIAHGEVRPQNILIGPDGQIKLTGFGVAAAQRQVVAEDTALLRHLVGYAAPDAEPSPTPSGDRYSLGCVLFEMLTGNPPYTGDTAVQIALKHSQEAVPLPSQGNAGVPPALDGIVRKAMGKTPRVRYTSDEEMLRDLKAVRDALRYGKSLSWTPQELSNFVEDATIAGSATTPRTPITTPSSAEDSTVAVAGNRPSDSGIETGTTVMPTASEGRWRSTASPVAYTPSATAVAAPVEEDEDEVIPVRSGGSRWLTSLNLFLIIVVIASAAGLFYMIGNFLKPSDEVVVPNLVGKTMVDAKTMSISQKFALSIVDKQYRDTEPADVIYQMGVAPGRHIKEGKAIPIWVSLGPRMVEVPDVRQLVFDKARRVLESKGLRLGEYKAEYDPLEPKGTVIKQVPPPGENRPRGTRVDLTLSKGEEPAPTPAPEETPASTTDTGLSASPAPEASPTTSGGEGSGAKRYFDIKYPVKSDGDQHRIRIDVLDDNGPRTVFDEVRKSADKVSYRVEAVGKQITIKVYDNDELRSELTK